MLLQRLDAVRAKHGYLLPHHGLMALAFPGLLIDYDAAYTALALDDRILSHHDRKFVWLAVLAAAGGAVATMIARGRIGVEELQEATLRDPEILRISRSTEVVELEHYTRISTRQRWADVALTL